MYELEVESYFHKVIWVHLPNCEHGCSNALASFEKSPEIKAHSYGAEYAKDNFPRRADPTLRFGLAARTLDSGVESGVDKSARSKHPMRLFLAFANLVRNAQ